MKSERSWLVIIFGVFACMVVFLDIIALYLSTSIEPKYQQEFLDAIVTREETKISDQSLDSQDLLKYFDPIDQDALGKGERQPYGPGWIQLVGNFDYMDIADMALTQAARIKLPKFLNPNIVVMMDAASVIVQENDCEVYCTFIDLPKNQLEQCVAGFRDEIKKIWTTAEIISEDNEFVVFKYTLDTGSTYWGRYQLFAIGDRVLEYTITSQKEQDILELNGQGLVEALPEVPVETKTAMTLLKSTISNRGQTVGSSD